MYAPGSPGDCKFFGMEKFSGWLESISAFSSKIAWRSPANCPMVLAVFARRKANLFVPAKTKSLFTAFV